MAPDILRPSEKKLVRPQQEVVAKAANLLADRRSAASMHRCDIQTRTSAFLRPAKPDRSGPVGLAAALALRSLGREAAEQGAAVFQDGAHGGTVADLVGDRESIRHRSRHGFGAEALELGFLLCLHQAF